MKLFDYTYILSALSLFVLWGVGNRWWWIWGVGLVSQVLWFYFIYDKGTYGLIPMHIAYTIIYTRNLIKWKYEK